MAKTDQPSGSAAAPPKNKGKGIAKASTKRTKKQQPATEPKENKIEYPPASAELYAKFMEMKFEQARFVDADVLVELELYGDVKTLFRNMGVERFMTMRDVAQKPLTCQFLSTLEVRFFNKDLPMDKQKFEQYGRGYIQFTMGTKLFTVSFGELSKIFGFEEEGTTGDKRFIYPLGELNRIWNTIASGNFEPGASKIASIRNPALRYALKALVHMFYAKIEVDTVTSEELEFLGLGLKPLVPVLADGGEFFGVERRASLAAILARSLMEYKTWAWKTKAKKAFIGIGWIPTAIMRAKAREVSLKPVDLGLMDTAYLQKTRFVKRNSSNTFVYSFYPTATSQAKVLLPNSELTRLDTLDNVIFNPPRQYYIENLREEYPEPIRGSARYDFETYTGPMNTTVATASAHERIVLLQRKVNWQQRTIEKMAKGMRGMKKTIKNMAKIIDELRCKGDDSIPTRAPTVPMETETGSSSHRVDKGKRKARSPTPTSSNEALSLDTASSSTPYQSE